MNFCFNCGTELPSDAQFCCTCGSATNPSTPTQIYNSSIAPSDETKTLAVVAMIFSIFCPIVGLICAIIGIIKYKNPGYKKISIIALITSIVWPIIAFASLLGSFFSVFYLPS